LINGQDNIEKERKKCKELAVETLMAEYISFVSLAITVTASKE
jgi:hypothetical protein